MDFYDSTDDNDSYLIVEKRSIPYSIIFMFLRS